MNKLLVLFSVIAVAMAKPSVVAPVAYTAVVPGSSSLSSYSTSVVHGSPYVAAPAVYSAPVVAPAVVPAVAALAQAPHSPAVVLDAVNGVPLDTPEVVAARVAHYQAKALSGYHHLGKRSVAPLAYSSVVGPVAYSTPVVSTYSAPLVSTYNTGVVSPLTYSTLYPRALSVHPY